MNISRFIAIIVILSMSIGNVCAEQQIQSHTYKRPGTFIAKVTVTDSNGNNSSSTVKIVVCKKKGCSS